MLKNEKLEFANMPTKPLMTRAEIITVLKNNVFGLTDTGQASKWIDFFIEAGLLEVKEENITIFETNEFNHKYGTIRIEEWKEGLIFWAGGKIVGKFEK